MANDIEDAVYIERTDPDARKKQAPKDIPGWGADLDPANRPAVPMERTPPRLEGVHWDAPSAQPRTVKILHSTERPGITPVFGTSVPPSGVSGAIRTVAFRYSENDVRHWLMLLFADRVNVVEGILDDLAHGHVPNLFAEMGGRAAWKHDRNGVIRKAVLLSAAAGLAVYWMKRRRAGR